MLKLRSLMSNTWNYLKLKLVAYKFNKQISSQEIFHRVELHRIATKTLEKILYLHLQLCKHSYPMTFYKSES